MSKQVKIAITGAAGQIGYALLFRLASGQVFGPDTEVLLSLIETEQGLPGLNGVAMELDDCAFPLLRDITCTADLNQGMDGVNWAVLIGAVPRKQGMERADLLQINGGIFTSQGQAINQRAADDVRVFVVGNPCNTNCYIAMKNANDIPNQRFFAMTALDENRAKTQLAQKAGVPVSAVSNLTIWGNHSATQYPDFYNAKINTKSAAKVIQDEAWLQNEFITTVQKRGAAVIQARGASSAASAANGIVKGVYDLVHDTPAGDSFSLCKPSQGEYGIDEDLIFSYPCRVDQGKLSVVTDIQHNAFATDKLQQTTDELRSERDAVIELGLVD